MNNPDNVNNGAKGLIKIAGTCVVTMGLAVLTIVLAILILYSSSCGAISRAIPVVLGVIAAIFIASGFIVRNIVRKVLPERSQRLAAVILYALALLVSYPFIAFVLLVIFNC